MIPSRKVVKEVDEGEPRNSDPSFSLPVCPGEDISGGVNGISGGMFLTLSITDETTSSICALEIAEVVAFASFFVCFFGVAGGAFVVVVAVASATLLVVGTDVVLAVVALGVVELGSVETGAGAASADVGAASVDGAVTLGVVSVVDVVGAALEFAAAALLAFSFAFSCIEAII